MKKMKVIDIAVTVLFIVALIVIYFFWKCKWDLVATIIALAIIVVAGLIAIYQHKKIDKLEDEDKSNK